MVDRCRRADAGNDNGTASCGVLHRPHRGGKNKSTGQAEGEDETIPGRSKRKPLPRATASLLPSRTDATKKTRHPKWADSEIPIVGERRCRPRASSKTATQISIARRYVLQRQGGSISIFCFRRPKIRPDAFPSRSSAVRDGTACGPLASGRMGERRGKVAGRARRDVRRYAPPPRRRTGTAERPRPLLSEESGGGRRTTGDGRGRRREGGTQGDDRGGVHQEEG